MDLELIKQQAKIEVEHELFREAVEAYKIKLKTKRSLWEKVFPWKIIIVKREKLDV